MAEKISREQAESLGVAEPSSEKAGGLSPEEGMEIFGNQPETLPTSQGPIFIGPMKMRQINAFIVHSKKFLPLLMDRAKGGDVNLSHLVGLDTDGFYQAMGAAVDQPVEVMLELYPDEFLQVVTKVLVVNMDFFLRILPVALGAAEISVMGSLVKMVQDGVAPSLVSSAKAIASRRSGTTPSAR